MFDFFTILHDNGLLLLMGQYPDGPLGGVLCTLLVSLLAVLFAFPVGVLLCLARLSPWRWLSWPVTCWIYLLRGIPLMMVVFWTYFCVPLLIGHNISGFSTMLCTLVIYESTYIAEIVRGGIQALPSGQYEASRALGMGHVRALRLVILPQALYNALPSLVSQLVSIIKDSTLGNQLLTKPFQVFAIVALSYYIINFSLTWLANRLELRIASRRQRAQSAMGKPVMPLVLDPSPSQTQ